MSLTITIPGAVEATTGAVAPAILTIGVGTPGATGPAGPAGAAGVGVPAGGTAGQFLTKIDGTNYNTDWTTVNLSAYAPLASPAFTGDPTAPTATFGDNDTSISTTAFVQAALAGGTAVAKNLEVYVRNQSGSTIAAGSIVYISGATGNRPLITLAQANNDANSAQTIGFVKTSIANNGFGNVIVRGELENIDTSALTEGAQLYLSPTTAGTWTTSKPSAPQHLVYVGIVLRSHPTQGTILVAVQNGYELGEIHDVALSSPANLDLLAYESSTDLWKNKSFSTLGLLTSVDAASTYQTLSGMSSYLTTSTAASTYYLQTNPSGFITSSALSGYATESWVTSQGYASLTVDEQNAISDASFTSYASQATYEYVFTGLGSFILYDSSVYSNNEQIQFEQSDTFNVTSFLGSPYSRTIYLPTIYGGSPTTYYLEDLVSYLAGLGIGFTASWSGYPGTVTLDTLAAVTTGTFWYLTKPVYGITTGSKFMIEAGLNDYVSTSAINVNAANGSAYIFDTGTMIWGKPWETWAYSKGVTDSLLSAKPNLSGTNNYSAGTQKLPASAAGYAPLNIAHGTAPIAPDNGDIWTTTAGLFYRINGSTLTPATLAGGTYTGKITTLTPSSSSAGLNLPPGAAPSAPVNGDLWTTTGGMTLWINGVTHLIATSRFGITFQSGAKCNTAASTASSAGFCIQQGTAPTTPFYGDMWITAANLLQVYTTAVRTIVVRETANVYSAAAKQTMSHSAAGGAGLNVGPVAADITSPASGDIWHNSTAGVTQIIGYSNSMRSAMSACRAFVSFNGTGTVAIRSSYNVSSITDNGVGTYTVNFTAAMVDANYLVSGSANDSTAGSTYLWLATGSAASADISRTTTGVKVQSIYGTNLKLDASTIDVVISR